MRSEAEFRARLIVANIVAAFAISICFGFNVAQGQISLALLCGGVVTWLYYETAILLKLGGGGGG